MDHDHKRKRTDELDDDTPDREVCTKPRIRPPPYQGFLSIWPILHRVFSFLPTINAALPLLRSTSSLWDLYTTRGEDFGLPARACDVGTVPPALRDLVVSMRANADLNTMAQTFKRLAMFPSLATLHFTHTIVSFSALDWSLLKDLKITSLNLHSHAPQGSCAYHVAYGNIDRELRHLVHLSIVSHACSGGIVISTERFAHLKTLALDIAAPVANGWIDLHRPIDRLQLNTNHSWAVQTAPRVHQPLVVLTGPRNCHIRLSSGVVRLEVDQDHAYCPGCVKVIQIDTCRQCVIRMKIDTDPIAFLEILRFYEPVGHNFAYPGYRSACEEIVLRYPDLPDLVQKWGPARILPDSLKVPISLEYGE